MKTDQSNKPLARKQGLVVKEVSGELLVYDLDRDRAHCLNETAAMVWKFCDGRTNTKTIASLMAKDLDVTIDEKIVWYALAQLGKDNLLEQQLTPPSSFGKLNRRDMIRALGIAAVVAVPVVTSIVAPTPAQAATCLQSGASCTGGQQCCSGLCNNNICA
ncbi:MAG TPA: PqqD family protein [Pyrinomonadaceae bacterium]|jgi:hypothetical protein